MPRTIDIDSYVKGVLEGSRAHIARAITLVESRRADHRELAQQMLTALLPHAGGARRVGISGVPGVGKSTFIDALGTLLTTRGHRVAVLTRGRTPDELPQFFRDVADAWKAAVDDGARFTEMQDAIRARDTKRIKQIWNELVPTMDEQTFYGFIAASESFKKAGFAAREAFGQVGFGTGGWDTDFPNSILEILRVVYTDADDQHRRILGEARRGLAVTPHRRHPQAEADEGRGDRSRARQHARRDPLVLGREHRPRKSARDRASG